MHHHLTRLLGESGAVGDEIREVAIQALRETFAAADPRDKLLIGALGEPIQRGFFYWQMLQACEALQLPELAQSLEAGIPLTLNQLREPQYQERLGFEKKPSHDKLHTECGNAILRLQRRLIEDSRIVAWLIAQDELA